MKGGPFDLSIGIPVLSNHALPYTKHVESQCLMMLTIVASPRLSRVDNNHVIIADDI